MSEIFRHFLSKFFGVAWVCLFDHDGTETVCRVKFRGGHPTADRHPAGIRTVRLLDNGGLSNGCYVERWEPYCPMSPKKWPVPPE